MQINTKRISRLGLNLVVVLLAVCASTVSEKEAERLLSGSADDNQRQRMVDDRDEVSPGNIIVHKQEHIPCQSSDFCTAQDDFCFHGGKCHFGEGNCSFCQCPVGYTGTRCENSSQNEGEDPEKETYINHYDLTGNVTNYEPIDIVTSESPTCPVIKRTYNKCPFNFACVNGECATKQSEDGLGGLKIWCECDEGWTGWKCHECCDLHCQNNGSCRVEGGTKLCHCPWGYKGEFCQTVHQSRPKWLWIPIVTGLLLTLLAGLAVALLCFMWRRRFWILIKIAYHLKEWEDTDGSQYLFDAFVSYKCSPADEHFVVHTLFPKLEQEMNFRLCLHFKDFQPGETIAENIIWAVEKSRRTILVLSPSYVTSEWTRMEYHVAQQQMLKLKHRIVPLIYKDIDHLTHIDRNLKRILDSVTYIQWPGREDSKKLDKFWERLRLSLPKKRVSSSSKIDEGSSQATRRSHESTSSSDSGVSVSSVQNSQSDVLSCAITMDHSEQNADTENKDSVVEEYI